MDTSVALLSAVCANHFDVKVDVAGDLAAGVANRTGYFLVKDEFSLGHALLWASRQDIDELHVLSSGEAGEYAQLAKAFVDGPNIKVWELGHGVVNEATPAEPAFIPVAKTELLDRASELASGYGCAVLSQRTNRVPEGAAGDSGTQDYASISCLGLEVARVIEFEGQPVIEIGVGQADREIHALTSVGSAEQILEPVVAKVKEIRGTDTGKFHPLHQIDPAGYVRFQNAAPETWVANLVTDDVFNNNARPAIVDGELRLYVADSSPTVYEHASRYSPMAESLTVVGREADLGYVSADPLAWLAVTVSLESTE